MALKLAPLAAAVILALGAAAAGGGEPAHAPATEPAAPTPPFERSASRTGTQKEWCPACGPLWPIPFTATLVLLLAPAMLGFFISGLLKRRHDWKPLVLGLFALGLGALATVWGLRDSFARFADMWPVCFPADVCAVVAKALAYLVWGLLIALAGGLFTVILRWRNAPRHDSDAEEAAEPEPEAES